MKSVGDEVFLTLDVGVHMVALCLRRGAFRDHTTIESLLRADDYELKFKDNLLEQPFFCRAGPRGFTVQAGLPMSDTAARRMLQSVCQTAGMGSELIC